jgi:hypothetical protein
MAIGVFPGSFDPLTTAHLAVAGAAIAAFGLERLDLVMSTVALAKDHGGHSSLEDRCRAIEALARADLRAAVTEHRLIADIAAGYDVCVLGADKWHQLHDLAFYDGSAARRDAALARLPILAVAPRAGSELPAPSHRVVVLDVDPAHAEVSSSAVRAGRTDWRATP